MGSESIAHEAGGQWATEPEAMRVRGIIIIPLTLMASGLVKSN